MLWLGSILKNCRFIESIQTSGKFVIYAKINPRFDGILTFDSLPLSGHKVMRTIPQYIVVGKNAI